MHFNPPSLLPSVESPISQWFTSVAETLRLGVSWRLYNSRRDTTLQWYRQWDMQSCLGIIYSQNELICTIFIWRDFVIEHHDICSSVYKSVLCNQCKQNHPSKCITHVSPPPKKKRQEQPQKKVLQRNAHQYLYTRRKNILWILFVCKVAVIIFRAVVQPKLEIPLTLAFHTLKQGVMLKPLSPSHVDNFPVTMTVFKSNVVGIAK